MSVFLIVMFGVYSAYEACQALFWRANAKTQVQQSVRMAIERMSRELRMAGYDPSGTGQVAVQNATSASLEFITDVDDNNSSDLVKYDRDAATGTLRRSVKAWTGTGWGPATVSVLATNANGLSFQYFPSAAVPGLKRIEISIQTSMPVPTQPTQQFQMTTDVLLRNL
jgi:Tfp pilus assembly protein PilW